MAQSRQTTEAAPSLALARFVGTHFRTSCPQPRGARGRRAIAPNDFDTLLLHELGHAMGMAHPPFDGSCPVMQVAAPCLGRINRVPDADDLAGLRFLYGPVFANGFE